MVSNSLAGRRVVAAALCLAFFLSGGLTAHAQVPPEIEVTQLHIFVSGMGERVQVTEYYLISNLGDEVFEGVEDPNTGVPVTLSFTLPSGAEALSFDGPGLGERFVELESGFADTEPIAPGTATVGVLFSYQLPYQEGMSIDRAFSAPVESVVMLSADPGVAIEGNGVRDTGTLETELGPAQSYAAGPLARSETLKLTLVAGAVQSPAEPAAVPQVRNRSRETLIGLVTLAAALPIAFLLLRPGTAPGPPTARVRALVDKIAVLDAEFEAGRVSEKEYRRRRRDLKRETLRLLE
jgi:hypothetical protein